MAVLGMRTTANLATDERPKAWRLGIMDEYPDANPLCNLIYRVGKEKVSDPEFNWFERRFPTKELTTATAPNSGAASDSGTAGSLVVGTGEAYNCKKGSVILNTATDELVLVTADTTDGITLSITRGLGETAGETWGATDKLQVIGNANPEGADIGSAITWDPAKKYGYCQIIRNVADTTRTLGKTLLRTGDKRKDAQKQALLDHETDKERSLLWSKLSENLTTTPGPTRTMAGLYDSITTNITDFGTTGVTMSNWLAALAAPMANGSDEKMLLCGSTALMTLSEMARVNSMQIVDVAKQDAYGMNLRRWITEFGTVIIKEHKLLSKSTKHKSWAFLVDPDDFVYRYVDDTEWLPGRQGNGADRFTGEYLAEVGFEIHNEYDHAVFKNMLSYVG